MNIFMLAQLVGFLSVILIVLTYQFNKRQTILVLSMFSQIIFVAHFLLLGAFTGATMNLIGATRNFLFMRSNTQQRSSFILYTLISVYIVVGFFTWSGPKSLLAVAGMIFGTLAFWQLTPRRIRLFALLAPPLWFSYNFLVHSYPGMIADSISFMSACIGILRFDIMPKISHRRAQ